MKCDLYIYCHKNRWLTGHLSCSKYRYRKLYRKLCPILYHGMLRKFACVLHMTAAEHLYDRWSILNMSFAWTDAGNVGFFPVLLMWTSVHMFYLWGKPHGILPWKPTPWSLKSKIYHGKAIKSFFDSYQDKWHQSDY